MELNERLQAIERGEEGELLQRILKTLMLYGEAFDAKRMVPVTSKYGHTVISYGLKALGAVMDLYDQILEAGIPEGQKFTADPKPLDKNVPSTLLDDLVFKKIMYTHQDKYEAQLKKLGITKDEDYTPFALDEVFTDIEDADGFRKGLVYAEAQKFSRDLANEPGCAIYPEVLAQKAQVVAEECGLVCEVWDEERLKAERMGALLAVGSGSKNPPRLIHLTYKPTNPKKKVAFVGKGITFDSGGLDIKPENFMLTMKGDKTGACNVLAIMKGVAELKPDVEVHGFMTCAENMPSGSAYKPDDIITARNGKTIEINNTDAEGRLVLSDALCVASELKPDVIIDMATLTGACMVALGKWRAGLFSNDDALAERLLAVSEGRGESFWRMPLEDEHIAETLKSPYADLVNCGERYGGAIFAALFLKEFVGEGIAWAHMDIAGVDNYDKESGVYAKGMTAFGVRTCLEYVMGL